MTVATSALFLSLALLFFFLAIGVSPAFVVAGLSCDRPCGRAADRLQWLPLAVPPHLPPTPLNTHTGGQRPGRQELH